jgi:hypothetical protein
MPRYFFNAYSGTSFTQDHEGQDLLDLEAAHDEAWNVAEQFWNDLPPEIAREALTIEMTEEISQEVTTVRYLEATRPREPLQLTEKNA